MGLFDFVSDIGEKIFGSDDDPAEKIKEHIESRNPGIKDLNVEFKDGKVNLSGDADSADAMEKAVLLAGNVKGVSDVGAGNVKAPAQAVKIDYYIIEKGDTLSGIAKKLLGNAMDYPKIFEANKEVIKDPNLIYPGQKIRIPIG